MANKLKYAANDALRVIDGPLAGELAIHRFDAKTRTKVHLFAVQGKLGKQFAIVLGNTDVEKNHHPAQQTRILLQRCDLPVIAGIEPTHKTYNGGRIKKNLDCKIAAHMQTSVLVADEHSLTRLLRWYAKN